VKELLAADSLNATKRPSKSQKARKNIEKLKKI
jgi:hypothetical protein